MNAPTRRMANSGGTTRRVFTANLPIGVMFGSSFLWRVRSISGLNSIRSPGIRVNTDNRLNRMALTRTSAMSRPILNSMKPSAARPDTVVRDEALISGMALLRAVMQASRAVRVSRSSVKRWHRMMA